jgi:hypothetical protein
LLANSITTRKPSRTLFAFAPRFFVARVTGAVLLSQITMSHPHPKIHHARWAQGVVSKLGAKFIEPYPSTMLENS